ncbi:hypothetical protein KSP40_PGU021738 [Platanthera guangdongensis]|uniref:Uncharacterized protein n=1 Tax=Platanthera guangdongensis TaxID=2320717 RepID=A0ABR2M5F2_9ASPA
MTARFKMVVRGSVLLLLILVLSLSLPYFEYVVGLTGSLIWWPRVGAPARVINVALIVVDGIYGVADTISSSRSLLDILQRSRSHWRAYKL